MTIPRDPDTDPAPIEPLPEPTPTPWHDPGPPVREVPLPPNEPSPAIPVEAPGFPGGPSPERR